MLRRNGAPLIGTIKRPPIALESGVVQARSAYPWFAIAGSVRLCRTPNPPPWIGGRIGIPARPGFPIAADWDLYCLAGAGRWWPGTLRGGTIGFGSPPFASSTYERLNDKI